MAELKPVYLICGDDEAKVSAWRSRVRARAEREGGSAALEQVDGRAEGPGGVAATLAALTFGLGTRYLFVEGVETWKAGDLDPLLAVLTPPPPDTVLVLVCRGRPQKALLDAVGEAGGEVREHMAPKPWELAGWVSARARELGLAIDRQAAGLLAAGAGPSLLRLDRELEKLALAVHPERSIDVAAVESLCPGADTGDAYALADAIAAGEPAVAVATLERLRARGESIERLLALVGATLREAWRAASMLEAGQPRQRVAEALGGPPWRAKKAIARAASSDAGALGRAVVELAELNFVLRNPGRPDDDTALTLSILRAAA